jgi:hypothetical protein
MADIPKVTRVDIAKLTNGDERMTRFLESLFRMVTDTTPADLSAIQDAAENAETEAAIAYINALSVKAELSRIADALEVLASAPIAPKNLPVATDYIDLDPNGPHVTQPYRVQWNAGDGTVDVGLLGGSVLQVGQELMYYAKNDSGGAITNGTTVMFSGAVGASGKLKFTKAVASGASPRDYMMGVATQDIASGEFGYVTTFGMVRGMDTTGTPYGETWLEGDNLYFSPTTAGGWTKVQPTTPAITTPVAAVVRVHANSGIISVRMHIEQATAINNTGRLIDSITTLTNGAGASVGTLTNSPVAGNPTKWVRINDNGTTRYIPAW